jgi:hypothetical protein
VALKKDNEQTSQLLDFLLVKLDLGGHDLRVVSDNTGEVGRD